LVVVATAAAVVVVVVVVVVVRCVWNDSAGCVRCVRRGIHE
jgi:hypothetical protein